VSRTLLHSRDIANNITGKNFCPYEEQIPVLLIYILKPLATICMNMSMFLTGVERVDIPVCSLELVLLDVRKKELFQNVKHYLEGSVLAF
jgi:hypothetical protein